jgi:hypothetical protein
MARGSVANVSWKTRRYSEAALSGIIWLAMASDTRIIHIFVMFKNWILREYLIKTDKLLWQE